MVTEPVTHRTRSEPHSHLMRWDLIPLYREGNGGAEPRPGRRPRLRIQTQTFRLHSLCRCFLLPHIGHRPTVPSDHPSIRPSILQIIIKYLQCKVPTEEMDRQMLFHWKPIYDSKIPLEDQAVGT